MPCPLRHDSDWDYWHIVQGVNISHTGVIGRRPSETQRSMSSMSSMSSMGGGIYGPMWQMIDHFDPKTNSFVPKTWAGIGGCIGECRPKNLAFIDATDVVVSNVYLRHSADWTQLFRRCHRVREEFVVVEGSVQWPNNDGLDLESGSDIVISHSSFRTGDDCLALRAGNCNTMKTPWPPGQIEPLHAVEIFNVDLVSTSCALKIEALSQKNHGDLYGIDAHDLNIHDTNRGIGLWQRVGNGSFHDIRISNVKIETKFMTAPQFWGSAEALVITTIPADSTSLRRGLTGIHNVTFENITARSEGGSLIASLHQGDTNPSALTNISLVNSSIVIAKLGNVSRAQHDLRPLPGGFGPDEIPALIDVLYVTNTAELRLSNVTLAFEGSSQYPTWSGHCLNRSQSNVTINKPYTCKGFTGK